MEGEEEGRGSTGRHISLKLVAGMLCNGMQNTIFLERVREATVEGGVSSAVLCHTFSSNSHIHILFFLLISTSTSLLPFCLLDTG